MHGWDDDDAVPMDPTKTVLVFCAEMTSNGLVDYDDRPIGVTWPDHILAFGEHWEFCGLTPLSDDVTREAMYTLDIGYVDRGGPILPPFEHRCGGLEVEDLLAAEFPDAIRTPGEFGATYTFEELQEHGDGQHATALYV